MHRGRNLMPAVQHTGMRKDHDASGSERRREIPFPPALQAFERSPLSQLVVLRAIELVNLLLELLTIESHFAHRLDAFAISRLLGRKPR